MNTILGIVRALSQELIVPQRSWKDSFKFRCCTVQIRRLDRVDEKGWFNKVGEAILRNDRYTVLDGWLFIHLAREKSLDEGHSEFGL